MQLLEGFCDVGNAIGKPAINLAARWEFWAALVGFIAVIFLAFIVVPGLKIVTIKVLEMIFSRG